MVRLDGCHEQEELYEVLMLLPSDLQALTLGPHSVSDLSRIQLCLPYMEHSIGGTNVNLIQAISITPSSCSRSFLPNLLGVRPLDPPRFSLLLPSRPAGLTSACLLQSD